MKKTIIGGMGVVLLLSFAGCGTVHTSTSTVSTTEQQGIAVGEPNPSAPSHGEQPAGKLRVRGDALFVAPQRPGDSIKVTMTFPSAPSFVVVYKDDNGEPGALLGVSDLLAAGDQGGTVVKLTSPVKQGDKLIAVLQRDNGDGKFNAGADLAVKLPEGDIVMSSFGIDANATIDPDIKF